MADSIKKTIPANYLVQSEGPMKDQYLPRTEVDTKMVTQYDIRRIQHPYVRSFVRGATYGGGIGFLYGLAETYRTKAAFKIPIRTGAFALAGGSMLMLTEWFSRW